MQLEIKKLFDLYSDRLFLFATKTISSKEDCEEIIQDIFLDLWNRRDTLGDIQNMEAYLFRMVKYKVIRYIQHSKVKQRYAEHYKLFEALYETESQDEKEFDLPKVIDKGLSELPERCRFAVKLRLTENLSNKAIAERMNIGKGTVDNYMVTAFNHFRKHYKFLQRATISLLSVSSLL
ncbi:RNA polymerase sigma-70 factor [Pseudochryseolinea flava]|uniref:RNA polymerase sigma-70 factor n=1 Tax=Pseudochryseolinea flava TaxID=2059302 RepID=A0A364Y634_9BACT|nr:RNA polymerase sigma-70 factor [Pseudochryseolinea flava]RAW01568.1 hypothetical protein DQQ10_07875 [Pseudochryseolinea flava]